MTPGWPPTCKCLPLVRHALVLVIALVTAAARADVVRILDDPREAVQARVDVIQQANDKVTLLYFLARDDRVTLGVLALLRDAKRRGVGDVRVIVDGSFHHIPKAVLALLRDEGVETRVYHPLNLRHPSWMFRRMHEKVIVADSARYITGGRNLGEAYFGLASKKNYVDRDVYVDGDSAADADRHFEDLWSSKHVAQLRVHVSEKEKQAAGKRLDEVLQELACSGVIALDTRRDWSAGRKDAGAVTFLRDPADRVSMVIEAAERSIVIESPYFIPSRSMRALLERKLAAGVQVLVVTNSLRSTDGLLPQAAYLKYRRRLVRAGVDFREFKGPDPLHAKSIVVDGRVALIGSYNIDPRSQYLNTEVMCMSEDEEIAREVRAAIDAHIENAWTIHRTAQAPRISRVESLRIWAAQMFLRLIEHQL
jgi:putative cardiolipin synthase